MSETNMNEDTNEVAAQPAVLRMTIGITRKATGLTETYEVIGTPVADDEQPEAKDE